MARDDVTSKVVTLEAGLHDPALTLAEVEGDNPQFQHALLCQLGLPRSVQPERHFERRNGKASLLVEAGRWWDGQNFIAQPLPYGSRPRLVMIDVCSEAVRTKSRLIDIGTSTRAFLQRLNIDCSGKARANFRKQMVALSCCHMTLGYTNAEGRPGQIKTEPVQRFEAWLVDDDNQHGFWPGELELSQPFFESLREHAVPLCSSAIASLQDSALALDAYSWLAHRLCRVRDNKGVFLSWQNMKDQFGQEYQGRHGIIHFRKKFLVALERACKVYHEARVSVVRGGIRLFPSGTPIKRAGVVVPMLPPAEPDKTAKPAVKKAAAKARKKPAAKTGGLMVEARTVAQLVAKSTDAVELSHQYTRIDTRLDYADAADRADELGISESCWRGIDKHAPGWCANTLMNKYYLHLASNKKPLARKPDAAYIGWVKSFTKGMKPGGNAPLEPLGD